MRVFAARALASRRAIGPVSRRALSSLAQANRSTYVSSYNQAAEPHEIAAFLSRKQFVTRESDTHFVVRECPFCHPTHGRIDNLFKLYVHKAQGVYKCHRCGASGSWFDFKSKVRRSETGRTTEWMVPQRVTVRSVCAFHLCCNLAAAPE